MRNASIYENLYMFRIEACIVLSKGNLAVSVDSLSKFTNATLARELLDRIARAGYCLVHNAQTNTVGHFGYYITNYDVIVFMLKKLYCFQGTELVQLDREIPEVSLEIRR